MKAKLSNGSRVVFYFRYLNLFDIATLKRTRDTHVPNGVKRGVAAVAEIYHPFDDTDPLPPDGRRKPSARLVGYSFYSAKEDPRTAPFTRVKGRELALEKLLDAVITVGDPEGAEAIWQAYVDRPRAVTCRM